MSVVSALLAGVSSAVSIDVWCQQWYQHCFLVSAVVAALLSAVVSALLSGVSSRIRSGVGIEYQHCCLLPAVVSALHCCLLPRIVSALLSGSIALLFGVSSSISIGFLVSAVVSALLSGVSSAVSIDVWCHHPFVTGHRALSQVVEGWYQEQALAACSSL